MEKQRKTLWLYPEDHRQLNILGAESELPAGDVVNRLLQVVQEKAEERREYLIQHGAKAGARQPVLSLAMMKPETIEELVKVESQGQEQGGFSGEDGFSMKDKAAEIRRKDQEDGKE